MSVVCEFINWFIAEEIWGWFRELNGVYTVHSVFTVHIVHSVNTVHNIHTVHVVHNVVCTVDGMNHVFQYL
jgi:hypothetical protein